jgi:protein O-mannosyl-transferase
MRNRLLLLGATLVAFGGSLIAGFHFDDYAIFSDQALTSFSGFARISTLARQRPLADFTLLLNNLAGGRDPLTYHLLNLALHMAAVLLVFACLRRLLPEAAALAGAAVFALHPIQAEAVNYVSARGPLLGAVLCLCALLAWLARRRWVAVPAFFAAVLAYPQCAAFPLLVALVEWGRLARPSGPNPSRRAALWTAFAATSAIGALGLVRLYFTRPHGSAIPEYALAQGIALWRYARLAVIPYGFTIDPDVRTPAAWLGVLAWVSLAMAAVAAWRFRRAVWPLWLLAALILVLPGSSVFPEANMAPDERMYLAMFAFSAAAGLLLARVPTPILTATVATVLCLMSVNRTIVWMSDQRLWTEAVRRAPNKTRPVVELSKYLPAGRALELLQTAANNAPRDAGIAGALGRVFLDEKLVEAAVQELSRAITLDPNNAQYFNNRGVALAIMGETEGARADFEKALEIDPGLIEAQENYRKLPPAQ